MGEVLNFPIIRGNDADRMNSICWAFDVAKRRFRFPDDTRIQADPARNCVVVLAHGDRVADLRFLRGDPKPWQIFADGRQIRAYASLNTLMRSQWWRTSI
jgi:hypothetical protein